VIRPGYLIIFVVEDVSSVKNRAVQPKEEDWFNVRFLDEVHFGLGPSNYKEAWREVLL